MDIKKQIQSVLNQAEVYKSQGLLKEAKEKYVHAGKMIQKHAGLIRNHQSLLASLSKKIDSVKNEIQKLEAAPMTREMPEQVQRIIKERFAFSKEGAARELEGALALAQFGQYARAMEELKGLLGDGEVRLEAAKNIIRCHVALDAPDDAVQQYLGWMKSGLFDADEAQTLRTFFQVILDKKGAGTTLPEIGPVEADVHLEMESSPSEKAPPDTLLDISSVGIPLGPGVAAGKSRECDVCFQSGNNINLLLSDREKDLLDILEPGAELEPVQFFSPVAMFEGKASVLSKKRLDSGPKKGDYSIDIQIIDLL